MYLGYLPECQSIIDRLPDGFDRAFTFLRSTDLDVLDVGAHVIDGDDLLAIVADDMGRGKSDSPLEYHSRFADIQLVVSGIDLIGWRSRSTCKHPTGVFDEDRDLGFFSDQPTTWLTMPKLHFAIFFPDDAHAPLAGNGPIKKVVMKVPIA